MAFLGFVIPIIIAAGVQAGLAWLSKSINPTPQSGRLGQDDFHTLESAYSLPLPKCWGTERVAGNITWVGPVVEHKYNVGSGLLSDGVDFFYYTQDVEYSFTLGPALGFIKIWLGDKVIYDASGAPTDAEGQGYGNNLANWVSTLNGSDSANKDKLFRGSEFFLGTETQEPSRIVSMVEGFGTVPADRGIVKIVIQSLNLTKLGGNALPATSAIIQFAEYTPVDGEAIATVLPTVTDTGFEGDTFGGLGTATSSLTSGEVAVQHLSTFNSFWFVRWSGFPSASIPAGATITAIYPTAEAIEWDETGNFNSAYKIAGDNVLIAGGGGIAAAPGFSGPPSATSEPSSYGTYQAASIGTSLSDLESASIAGQFYTTVSTTGTGTLRISNPRMEVHYTYPLIPPTGTTLAQIVADLCEEAGLTSDQYDVSELTVVPVKGFKTEQKAIRDVIRELMEIYPFDGYESDAQLKFVLRTGDPIATIPEDDFVLSGDSDSGYRLSEPIVQEDEIPMKTEVHYADIDRDFQDSIQYSKRIIGPEPTMESITVKSVSTNVVMNANEGAQAAERINWEGWATRRGGNCQLMPKHMRLDPSDKVQFNYKNQTLIQRITNATLGAGLGIELSTLSHDSDVYESTAIGTSNGDTFPVPLPSSADPGLVNEPVMFEPPESLVPSSAAGALWIQVSGSSPDYGGCEVFISLDPDFGYQSLGDMPQGITGYLTADYPVGSDPDTVDTLPLDLTECSGDLSTRSRGVADAFLDLSYLGVNSSPAVRDFELACPTKATESSTDSLYALTEYIRRGVHGSDILDHPTGSRFADLNGAIKINLSPAWIGITLYFKFAAYNLSHQHPAHQRASDLTDCVVYRYMPLGAIRGIAGWIGEVPFGPIDGSNRAFGLLSDPRPPQSLFLFRNGLVLRPGVDYVVSGSAITLTVAPDSGDWLYSYRRVDGNTASYNDGFTPSGAIDSLNTDFVLPTAPDPAAYLLVFLNGLLQIEGTDYTLSSDTITMGTAPQAASGSPVIPADWLLAWARIDGISADSSSAEVPSGTINGSNATFTITDTPVPGSSLMLFQNGMLLLPSTHYTIVGATITMVTAPETGASLVAFYYK